MLKLSFDVLCFSEVDHLATLGLAVFGVSHEGAAFAAVKLLFLPATTPHPNPTPHCLSILWTKPGEGMNPEGGTLSSTDSYQLPTPWMVSGTHMFILSFPLSCLSGRGLRHYFTENWLDCLVCHPLPNLPPLPTHQPSCFLTFHLVIFSLVSSCVYSAV